MTSRFTLLTLTVCLLGPTPDAAAGGARWETLERCRLESSFLNDGDSFLVNSPKGQHVFRLYFVDAAEVSGVFPERVKDQANYFSIPKEKVTEVGRRASDFTRRFLSGVFTVHTLWQDGWGQAKRYLAVVEKDGSILCEALAANGLVRIYGFEPPSGWPGGEQPNRIRTKLRRAEALAKRQRSGGWGSLQARRAIEPTPDDDPSRSADREQSGAGRVDVNRASREELIALQGIGESLADQIIARRPWRNMEDLLNIKGIGPATLARLSPQLTIGQVKTFPGTADYYREHRKRWLNRFVRVSIASIEEKGWPAPDGFVVLSAQTSVDGYPGGSIPIFIPDDRLQRVKDYYSRPENVAKTQALFYQFQGTDVLVIPR